MLHCDDVPALLSLALDDDLEHAERGRMNRHLAGCAGCRQMAAQMRELDMLFRNAPMKYAPLGFTERAVTAAFEADMKRNLGIGVLTLLAGTLLISGLLMAGQLELILSVLATLIAPGSSATLLLAQLSQALQIAGRAGWVLLSVMRGMLVGPLLVPSLLSLMGAALVLLVMRRSGNDILMTTF